MWCIIFPTLRKSKNLCPELGPYGRRDHQALSTHAKLKYNYIFKGYFKTDGSFSIDTSLDLTSLSQLPCDCFLK